MMLVTVIPVPISPTSPPAVRLQDVTADNRGFVTYGVGYRNIHRNHYADICRKFTSVGSSPVFVGDEITTV